MQPCGQFGGNNGGAATPPPPKPVDEILQRMAPDIRRFFKTLYSSARKQEKETIRIMGLEKWERWIRTLVGFQKFVNPDPDPRSLRANS